MDEAEQADILEAWADELAYEHADDERPVSLSNHAWAIRQLGYPPIEPHWGWTGKYRSER